MSIIEFPQLDYLLSGNPYSGSFWEDGFNYSVRSNGEALSAAYWYGAVVQGMADEVITQEFPLSEEGLSSAHAWLEQSYQKRRRLQRINVFTYQEPDSTGE